jgi:hypothetical protein
VVGSLIPHGGANDEDSYGLCYVRGPEGMIVELAERIS